MDEPPRFLWREGQLFHPTLIADQVFYVDSTGARMWDHPNDEKYRHMFLEVGNSLSSNENDKLTMAGPNVVTLPNPNPDHSQDLTLNRSPTQQVPRPPSQYPYTAPVLGEGPSRPGDEHSNRGHRA